MSPVRRASHATFCSHCGVFRLHIDLRRVAAAQCCA